MKGLYIQKNLPRRTVQDIWCLRIEHILSQRKYPNNAAISHKILACHIAPVLKLPVSFPQSRENEM